MEMKPLVRRHFQLTPPILLGYNESDMVFIVMNFRGLVWRRYFYSMVLGLMLELGGMKSLKCRGLSRQSLEPRVPKTEHAQSD